MSFLSRGIQSIVPLILVNMNKDPKLQALGQQIQALRKAKGFSQEGFAQYAELERSYYGRIERGEANITIKNLIRVAKALKVKVRELIPEKL